MSTNSDVLHPDGTNYDSFLFAEVGEDRSGATVTVVSALARLGLEPWTEARVLARLGRSAAQARLKIHLAAITEIPSLSLSSDSMATTLVALLPKESSRRVSDLPPALKSSRPRISLFWLAMALIGVLALTRIYVLAHGG